MKKLIIPIVALLLFSFTADTNKLTDDDRKMVVDHLKKTRDHMSKILKGLSDEQLNFQPEEEAWSIADCLEHITISENAFGGLIQKTVAAGPNPSLKDSVKLDDQALLGIILDRSNKVKTSEPFEPSGKFGSAEETLKTFMSKRAEHIAYMESTDDDLRRLYNSDLPFGTIDGVQLILFMSGHTERHVNQMEEIMTNRFFPENVD
ncbi:DinB family protein [Muricauda sp. 2012CJ35-5]|uniref:DinB family protein n=1 Tax=Flagellimonas spongiicola TaxID=2942208 RepID=A0ABT0PRQ1_9FLAO|nr:DinB family protein [Allomuricauda spongiicola]MCL6274043.1 DinB family protein [Allomuricauda spongiicola]